LHHSSHTLFKMMKVHCVVSGSSAFTAQRLRVLSNTENVVFPNVIYNEGNDYNATSGVFTCRIPGIYWFSATLMNSQNDQSQNYCMFLLNGKSQVYVFVPRSSTGGVETGTGSEVMRLNQGDRVQVGGCYQNDHFNSYDISNSFSGMLIKANDG